MKKFILIILLTLLPITANAFDEWTDKDELRQRAYMALHLIDWMQTSKMASDDMYFETNPLLGRHPSTGKINTYFAATLVFNYVVARTLQTKYRNTWQSFWLGVKTTYVGHNYQIGVRVLEF